MTATLTETVTKTVRTMVLDAAHGTVFFRYPHEGEKGLYLMSREEWLSRGKPRAITVTVENEEERS